MVDTKFLTYKLACYQECTMEDLGLICIGLLAINLPIVFLLSAFCSVLVGKMSAWFMGIFILDVVVNYKLILPAVCRKLARHKDGKEPMYVRLILKKKIDHWLFFKSDDFIDANTRWSSRR